ncbi:E3 ubiquitin-protein ligase RNF217-like isoform X2 [Convolutriloba macropyga]|uniref:E3 ubiquitin-protein ligase RNF217-like isoform X2 n=1 Tax=Convolutriloba macropyga TaxID=536237 RepID=UPI003F526789
MSQSELPHQTADQIHPEAEDPPKLPETPPPPPPPGELEVSEMTEISESVDQGANQNRAETVLDLSRDTLGDNTSTNAALAEVQSETSFSTDRRAWLLCFICLELASGEKMSCCKNFTCYMCFKLHVKTQISGGRFEITCPFCDKSVQQSEMLECLDEKTRKVLARLLLISSLKKNEKLCPKCDFLQKVPMSQTKPQTADAPHDITCSQCSLNWCFYCHSPSHKGLSCKENQKPDTAFVEWRTTIDPDLNPNAQKCPKCQIHIQRDGGCTHMKCSRCKTDFCYKCGKGIQLDSGLQTVSGRPL